MIVRRNCMRCALGAHLIGADRRCEHVFANTELNKTKNEIRQETKQALSKVNNSRRNDSRLIDYYTDLNHFHD